MVKLDFYMMNFAQNVGISVIIPQGNVVIMSVVNLDSTLGISLEYL